MFICRTNVDTFRTLDQRVIILEQYIQKETFDVFLTTSHSKKPTYPLYELEIYIIL